MIQRIQSIWLLLAALTNAGLFYFCLYSGHVMENGADTVKYLRVSDHYPSLLIALVTVLLPLVTIFMFKNRKRQRSMIFVSILVCLSFISMTLIRVNKFTRQVPAPTDTTYRVAAILPALAIIFLILAIRGISKDEKLVKSLDRLR
jgi:peptidoglycan/LPS O-acetylase OafA/YrhL